MFNWRIFKTSSAFWVSMKLNIWIVILTPPFYLNVWLQNYECRTIIHMANAREWRHVVILRTCNAFIRLSSCLFLMSGLCIFNVMYVLYALFGTFRFFIITIMSIMRIRIRIRIRTRTRTRTKKEERRTKNEERRTKNEERRTKNKE